jgi:hypothetical protein
MARPTSFLVSESFFDVSRGKPPALLPQQVNPTAPVAAGYSSATSMVVADTYTLDRMDHFPEEIYNLAETSHLVRFVRAMLGPGGVGQLRSRYLINQLASTLTGSHFFDLDRFYGALFGAVRLRHEVVPDATTTVATQAEWDAYLAADATYREKIIALAASIPKAATLPGIQAAAEAVTGVECDVYEMWPNVDATLIEVGPPKPPPTDIDDPNLRTWDGIEGAFPTYTDVEGHSYQNLGNPTLSMSAPETPLGTQVPYTRQYNNVQTDYSSYEDMEADLWADIEGGTGSAGPFILTLTVNNYLNVVLNWDVATSAIGYEVIHNGALAFTTGPAGTTPASVRTFTDANLTPTVHTYQIQPYTAYDSSSGVRIYGPASNSVTVLLTPPPGGGGQNLPPEDQLNRSVFVVRPKKEYDSDRDAAEEQYALGRVLQRLKPAGSLARISSSGVGLLSKLYVANMASDSEYWEVTTKVVPKPNLATPIEEIYPLSERQQKAGVASTDTREIPKPVHTHPQTTEWSYNSQIVRTSAYSQTQDGQVIDPNDYEVVVYENDQQRAYNPDKALMNAQLATATRMSGDGTIVAAPYSSTRLARNG